MSDNQVYPDLTSPSSFSGLSSEITMKADYIMVADPGYDDQCLYESSLNMGFQLVCPIHRYKNTP
jgi:hypothetical protein